MEVQRLFDILPFQMSQYPQEIALAARVRNQWKSFDTASCQDEVDRISRALIARGIQAGDYVAIISENRYEWTFTDLAIQQVGAIVVPVYPNSSLTDYAFALSQTGTRLAFVSGLEILEKVLSIWQECPNLQHIVSYDSVEEADDWNGFLEAGGESFQAEVEARKSVITEGDLATIIFTSGSTGTPKGVMLSHKNILSNLKSTLTILPVDHQSRTLSFLPFCHIFERMVIYTYFFAGASIHLAENLDTLEQNLKEIKPHYFTTVPRLLEKIYERSLFYGYTLRGIRRMIFFKAFRLGQSYQIDKKYGLWFRIKLMLARRFVFDKLVQAMGGELKGIVTGAAALSVKLCRIFCAAGIPVREGYGQTEASPVLSLNRFEPGGAREGTVGLPIPGVEIRIAANGEILARGPNVMLGYFNREDLTRETLDDKGWLHTGDLGELVGGRFLRITGRIKDLFKTSGGKYVAPLPLETRLSHSPYIRFVMVVGENRKYPAALIVPDTENINQWAADAGLATENLQGLLIHPRIRELFQKEIDTVNQEFARHAQIKTFALIPETWTPGSGELTPSLKLRRPFIHEKYADHIEKLYSVTQGA